MKLPKSLIILLAFAVVIVVGYTAFFQASSSKDKGPFNGLVVSNVSYSKGPDGQRTISGVVQNTGSAPARNVGIQFKIYTGDGAELGTVIAPLSMLESGNSTTFAVPVDDTVEGFSYLNTIQM